MQKFSPLSRDLIEKYIAKFAIKSLSGASIREIVRLALSLEKEGGIHFIHMEMGVPGLPPNQYGINAQIEALKKGVAAKYPHIEGIPELKTEIAKFAKLFMDVEVKAENCFPTVGSMQGAFAVFMTISKRKKGQRTLFIDPGFPVQKQQHRVLGLDYESFDVHAFRGRKLKPKLESYMKDGKISSLIYSSPNNPSWIAFTDDELKTIGELCEKYDVTAIEDLAYFAMDFRKDYSKPGEAPFQPSVAKYTDNYVILISSSKVFSYAGERIAAMIVSEKLAKRNFEGLKEYFGTENFGHALVYGALYSLSSGTGHSSQYALAEMLKSANRGDDFMSPVKEYGRRAKKMKDIFLSNGFRLIYDKDGEEPLADGFYFTIAYPGMDSEKLLRELLRYGVSAISLGITGSHSSEGIRACVSLSDDLSISELEVRMKIFSHEHKR
ncbi:MAG TPA: pyridoxal phosphate-dependent aminotransferase [Victivallales bacterium]|nr:pyridoxal phosphate-dependent aminotransferase [Victivallales bacterium]